MVDISESAAWLLNAFKPVRVLPRGLGKGARYHPYSGNNSSDCSTPWKARYRFNRRPHKCAGT